MNFESCWNRVKQSTGLHKQTQLAKFLEISSSNISEAKAKDRFALAWAFKIGQANDISTDWILTGKGPMNGDEVIRQAFEGNGSATHQALSYILEHGNTYQRGVVKGYLSELVEEITDQNKKKDKPPVYGRNS